VGGVRRARGLRRRPVEAGFCRGAGWCGRVVMVRGWAWGCESG